MSSTGRWEELFGSRRWRVAEEVTGSALMPGPALARGKTLMIRVEFARGEFEITPPGAFVSPLSTNLGRRGVLLHETDASGVHDIPGSRIAIGRAAVDKAREQFGAIW